MDLRCRVATKQPTTGVHLFAYGTLMCPEIMTRVVGFLPASRPARLEDHHRGPLRGVDYPAIIASRGSRVEGLLYLDLPGEAWARLDEFEAEIYLRQTVTVTGNSGERVAAETYLLRPEYRQRLGNEKWSYREFLRRGKARFLRDYAGFPVPAP